MKQLIQNLKTGVFSIVECPLPSRPVEGVLIRTQASLISAGTERGLVKAAEASLLGKARQRPDKLRQVLDNVKKEGLGATYRKVQEKLDAPLTLGYSSAGVVIECDETEAGLQAGMRVACAGANYACHAEVVAVPRNLVTTIPDAVSNQEACFATVGSIALQGIRRARVGLGDRVLVIGLGLLGQITWQLLRDAGCVAIGADVSERTVELAREIGLEHAVVRGTDDVEGLCQQLTNGHGVDAVIITAATKSRDPIELAGEVCRERGVVSVVGMVPMEIPREPYYMKELDFVISRSYGPGRYDVSYEEGGHDYPYAHVRWTEGRNLQAVLESMAQGRLDVKSLTTHTFPFSDVLSAYEIVSGRKDEFHVGIVLEYPDTPRMERVEQVAAARPKQDGEIGIGFIGAGAFAKAALLPEVKGRKDVILRAVSTSRGFTATETAKRFGFERACTDTEAVLGSSDIDAVFITTRHDSHSDLICAALDAGKHVFVEKPLCLSRQELERISALALSSERILQAGFNRRFSPLAVALKKVIASAAGPVQTTYRVNAGQLPADHWLNDPAIGGGRMVGEGCHFVDLMSFFSDSLPVRVYASRLGRDADGVTTVQVEFENGSVGSLVYQANAPKSIAKERVEVFSGGRGGVIDDWKKVELWEESKRRKVKVSGQAKGFNEEIDAFVSAIRTGEPPISLASLRATTLATIAALESIARGRVVRLDEMASAGKQANVRELA